jgi:hypothetical protein
MPDDEFDPEQEDEQPTIRDLREQLKGKKQVEARAAELERQLAFAKAGVADSPLVAQLAKGYEGENDPAAIRAYFESLGVDLATGATPSNEASGPSEEELASQRAVAQVGSAGEAGGDIRFEDAINSATSPEDVMALIASAPEGATGFIDGRDRQIRPPHIE